MKYRIAEKPVTKSTNDDVKAAAIAGEAEGAVVWALKQTAGRGRQGRKWESPEGNLYCSVLLRPKTSAKDIGQYSFLAALAIYDTISGCLPKASVALKWPNDVLVDGKKISGVLLETESDALIVGMGLNVKNHPDNAMVPATSLAAAGSTETDLPKLLGILLGRLAHWYDALQAEGFAPIRAAWLKHAQKGPLSVRLPQETLEGTFADLDEKGSLRLRLADGSERAIATGDVFIR